MDPNGFLQLMGLRFWLLLLPDAVLAQAEEEQEALPGHGEAGGQVGAMGAEWAENCVPYSCPASGASLFENHPQVVERRWGRMKGKSLGGMGRSCRFFFFLEGCWVM